MVQSSFVDLWPKCNLRTVPACADHSCSKAFKTERCWNSLNFTSVLASEPGTEELYIHTHHKCSLEAQAITVVQSLEKLLYRVFFTFWYECRCELRTVAELPEMLRVTMQCSANSTEVN